MKIHLDMRTLEILPINIRQSKRSRQPQNKKWRRIFELNSMYDIQQRFVKHATKRIYKHKLYITGHVIICIIGSYKLSSFFLLGLPTSLWLPYINGKDFSLRFNSSKILNFYIFPPNYLISNFNLSNKTKISVISWRRNIK